MKSGGVARKLALPLDVAADLLRFEPDVAPDLHERDAPLGDSPANPTLGHTESRSRCGDIQKTTRVRCEDSPLGSPRLGHDVAGLPSYRSFSPNVRMLVFVGRELHVG